MIQILIVLASLMAGALCMVLILRCSAKDALRVYIENDIDLYETEAKVFRGLTTEGEQELKNLINAGKTLRFFHIVSAVLSIIYGVLIIALLAACVYGVQG